MTVDESAGQSLNSVRARSVPLWVAALCLMISLAGIVDHDLWTPDEHREAAIALSMSRSGNIVVPELAGQPFVEKPPLYYMLAVSAIWTLGPVLGNIAALRLVSALLGLGAIGMTWLIARRIIGRRQADIAALTLATMPGFINVTHWLLVDNALLFFIVASLWAFAEAYYGGRGRFLPLAGLFLAGAFLSKGLIGIMITGLAWIGLIAPCLAGRGKVRLFTAKWMVLHLAALAAFLLPSLAWVLEFRSVGGPELWHEWFWENHFGRFAGHTEHLGHINGPFYYVDRLIVYTLPWTAALIYCVYGLFTRWKSKEYLKHPWPFLLAWGFGGILLLSLSSTKRDIYMLGLLPAFAMMGAMGLKFMQEKHADFEKALNAEISDVPVRWVRAVLVAWSCLVLVILAVAALAPILIPAVSLLAPDAFDKVGGLAVGWKMQNTVALVALFLLIVLMTRKKMPFLHRWFAVTGAGYVFLLAALIPVVDGVKSYDSAFFDMAADSASGAGETALWRPDETTLGGFYFYCDLILPTVSDIDELVSILNGTHPRFTSVVVSAKNFPPGDRELPAWSALATSRMGPRRALLRIAGDDAQ